MSSGPLGPSRGTVEPHWSQPAAQRSAAQILRAPRRRLFRQRATVYLLTTSPTVLLGVRALTDFAQLGRGGGR